MKIGMHRLRFFILLFAASSLLFQFPSEAFATTPSDITVTDTEIDGENGFDELNTLTGVDTFTIGSGTYAIVTSYDGIASNTYGAVTIIDISDPTNIVVTDTETDGVNGFDDFFFAIDVDTFTIGSSTYAIVIGSGFDGVQMFDISDPTNIVATDTETDEANGFTNLDTPSHVETFTIGSSTYAIVLSPEGVQIIDISDPTNIVATDAETDGENGFTNLPYPGTTAGVDTFTVGSSTYAIVTGSGIQIIDISDPTDIVAKDSATHGENGFNLLTDTTGVETFTIGSSTYAIVTARGDNGVTIIDISDPTNITVTDTEIDGVNGFTELGTAVNVATFTIGSSTYAIVVAHDEQAAPAIDDNGVQIIDISDPTNIVAKDAETDGVNGFDKLDGAIAVDTFTIGSSTYAIVIAQDDDSVTIIELNTVPIPSSGTCTRHVILGNCGTIAINNDEYRIINTWTNVPTTEVMVGEPVSITLSTPHNYAAGKINSVSIYTEIFGSAANYELGSHIDYSVMKSDYYVSESELFQVAGATHRIVQDPDVKNLKMFEVVFTMVFAKPMDTSYIVVETKNRYGIPETIYLGNALKVIERPIELLTMEEKSKFKIISEPELKVSLRPDMDIEPDMDMLAIDPEPVVSKVTCGNGTMLNDNMCVANEMSFYFFFNQFMRLFG